MWKIWLLHFRNPPITGLLAGKISTPSSRLGWWALLWRLRVWRRQRRLEKVISEGEQKVGGTRVWMLILLFLESSGRYWKSFIRNLNVNPITDLLKPNVHTNTPFPPTSVYDSATSQTWGEESISADWRSCHTCGKALFYSCLHYFHGIITVLSTGILKRLSFLEKTF